MKRKSLACFLLILIIANLLSFSNAHDSQQGHDEDLKKVLFGTENAFIKEKEAFQIIADAASISIDQFSPNDSINFKERSFNNLQYQLKKLNLPTIKTSFDQINLNKSVSMNNSNITANSHRLYTHLGWNYKNYINQKFWEKRKQFLIDAVHRVVFIDNSSDFKIPFISDLFDSPNEQCKAFSGLIYYTHIIGDHIDSDVPEKLTNIVPLIQYTSISSPGIIVELCEQLEIIFSSQTSTHKYSSLMQELSALKTKVEKNCKFWGSVDTQEKCIENQRYAKELIEILSNYVPNLLKNEIFFKNRFKN